MCFHSFPADFFLVFLLVILTTTVPVVHNEVVEDEGSAVCDIEGTSCPPTKCCKPSICDAETQGEKVCCDDRKHPAQGSDQKLPPECSRCKKCPVPPCQYPPCEEPSRFNAGCKAGIGIGVVCAVVLLGFCGWMGWKKSWISTNIGQRLHDGQ